MTRPLVLIDGFLYSVYLLYMPLLLLFARLLPHAPGQSVSIYLLAVTGLVIIVPLSFGFYKLFEQPFMNRAPRPAVSRI